MPFARFARALSLSTVLLNTAVLAQQSQPAPAPEAPKEAPTGDAKPAAVQTADPAAKPDAATEAAGKKPKGHYERVSKVGSNMPHYEWVSDEPPSAD